MDREVYEAATKVARAIRNEGPQPEWHRGVMERHRQEWPTLWKALDDLLEVVGPTETVREFNQRMRGTTGS